MSLNHLTSTSQGISDKLEIGCNQCLCGDLLLDNKAPLQNQRPAFGKTTFMVCDITDEKVGGSYEYNWNWEADGVLLLQTPNLSGSITSVWIVGSRSEVPVFLSACRLNYTEQQFTLLQFSSLIGGAYNRVTTPVKIVVEFEF